jgi:hypothetical protein
MRAPAGAFGRAAAAGVDELVASGPGALVEADAGAGARFAAWAVASATELAGALAVVRVPPSEAALPTLAVEADVHPDAAASRAAHAVKESPPARGTAKPV